MKKILSIILLFVSLSAFANCDDFYPFGHPIILKKDVVYSLCRSEYTAEYSATRKTSYWSATVLTKEKSLGRLPRKDMFAGDPDVALNDRALPNDYRNSGYDKGHLTANKDVGADPKAAKETFYMSNIIPQSPGNNQNGWRELEEYLRELTLSIGDLYVITGPIYTSKQYKYIGNGVAVPDKIFKIIVSKNEKFFLCVLVPNEPISKQDLSKYITDMSTIEKAAGVRFFPIFPGGYTLRERL